jgi:hypothetical protein
LTVKSFVLHKVSNDGIAFDYKTVGLFDFRVYEGKYVFLHIIGNDDGGVMDIENGRLKIMGVDAI